MINSNVTVFGVTVPASLRFGSKYVIVDIGGFATIKLGMARKNVGRQWFTDAVNVVHSSKSSFRKWFVSELVSGFESTELWKHIAKSSGIDVSNLSPCKIKEIGKNVVENW